MKNNQLDKLPDNWIIRPAIAEDAYNIADVHLNSAKLLTGGSTNKFNEHTLETGYRRWTYKILENKLDIFVLYENDTLLSFGDVELRLDKNYNDKIAEICRFYSNPTAIMKKPGHFLFQYFIQHYKSAGFKELFGWVVDTNTISRQFYERMGAVLEPNAIRRRKELDYAFTMLKYVYPLSK